MERNDLLALARVEPFSRIDIVELDNLLRRATYTVRSWTAGATIALAGTDYEALLCVLDGSVRAVMDGPGGKALTVETLDAPVSVASAVLFADEPALPVTVTALTAARIMALPREVVLDLCAKNRVFLTACLAEAGNKLRLLAEKLRLLEFHSIRQKVAAWLLPRLVRGRSVRLPFAKEQLAELFGVARPSLSRELSAMAHDGLIAVNGREIEVLKPEALRRLLAAE